jgi:hypothetical protein
LKCLAQSFDIKEPPFLLFLSGIALGYGLDDRGFVSRQGLGIFLFTVTSRPALGPTQSAIQWVPRAVFLVLKRPGREADHSPTSGAEVKNAWRCTSTSQYAFMAWCSVEAQRQLYLSLKCGILTFTPEQNLKF